MQMKIPSEKIVIVGRFGYFKLFNSTGLLENNDYENIDGEDYKKLFWRFYWRV